MNKFEAASLLSSLPPLDFVVIAECDGDIKIVTELPKEMFKKPKLKEYYSQLGKQAEHAELYSPAFSKRLAMKNAIFPGIPRTCGVFSR